MQVSNPPKTTSAYLYWHSFCSMILFLYFMPSRNLLIITLNPIFRFILIVFYFRWSTEMQNRILSMAWENFAAKSSKRLEWKPELKLHCETFWHAGHNFLRVYDQRFIAQHNNFSHFEDRKGSFCKKSVNLCYGVNELRSFITCCPW